MNTKLGQAVFFDRDGVINEVVDRGEDFFVKGKKVRFTAPFNYSEFEIKPAVARTLEEFGRLGFVRIIVTNQPDLTYGSLPKVEHERIMKDVLNLPVEDVFVCPHGRDEGCQCKKPKAGMLLEAAQKWNINLSSSYMIGDGENDVIAGKSAGCRTIFIKGSGGTDGIQADFFANDLNEALHIIKNLQQK